MKKRLIMLGLCSVLLVGCGENEVVKTYNQSETGTVLKTYYEMNDGTWKCDDISYPFRLKLNGKMPNSEKESYYVVLTDNDNLTFEEVSKSLYGSLIEDSEVMEGSVIVEMK